MLLDAANLIGPETRPIPGEVIVSRNPAHPDRVIWSGSPGTACVDDAVGAACAAQAEWAGAPIDQREAALRAFQALATEHVEELADLICDETGKPRWDALGEAKLLAGKVDVTLDVSFEKAARHRVADYELEITPTRRGAARFRPHGVMAVVGPFNFPMHLPNGHIVPALLMGNTVVFKPSDKAPACGHRLAELYREAIAGVGGPPGVVNLVHGAGDVAAALVTHAALDGILFTGSWPVGRRIVEANLDHPGRIIALEMGGNNAAYVHEDADLEHAALECLRGSFISAGQRCTCTRRIVVHERVIDAFVKKMATLTSTVLIGDPRGEAGQDVFMGPVITEDAATAVVNAQSAWVRGGATPVIESKVLDHPSGGHFVSPGITRVDRFTPEEGEAPGCDIEIFGPLVRIASVSSLDEAIGQVGATRFGLAAAVFTADVGSGGAAARFLNEVRAGCVNVNNATAGASGTLPFGGFGLSGNHRPAGAFSLDYCAAPVASLIETDTSQRPVPPGVRYGK